MRGDQRSPEAAEYRRLYKTARWLRVRARQLAEHPLCQRCEAKGKVVVATDCHHLNPAQKASPLTFFDGPFESLCADCHRGPARQVETIGYSTEVGEDGLPIDPNHPANR